MWLDLTCACLVKVLASLWEEPGLHDQSLPWSGSRVGQRTSYEPIE